MTRPPLGANRVTQVAKHVRDTSPALPVMKGISFTKKQRLVCPVLQRSTVARRVLWMETPVTTAANGTGSSREPASVCILFQLTRRLSFKLSQRKGSYVQ